MNVKSLGGLSTTLLLLTVALVLMGCAYGTTKTEAWKFDQQVIHDVRTKCSGTYPDAVQSSLAGLWSNKRQILSKSRACAQAANILADQADNRNKVLGN